MFFNMPLNTKITIIIYAIYHTILFGPNILLRSITPDIIFGSGPKDYHWNETDVLNNEKGDMNVKNEARQMMKEFKSSADKLNHIIVDEVKIPAPFN